MNRRPPRGSDVPRGRRVLAALACSAVALVAACGTRQSEGSIAAHADGKSGEVERVDLAKSFGGAAPADHSPSGAASAPSAGPARTAGTSPSTARPGSGAGPHVGSRTDAAPATHSACGTEGTPVVIGQTGAFSGMLAQSTAGMRLGLSAWAKYVNARGGVQCHPVRLVQKDDASHPAEAEANVDALVRNKHAVAIVGADVPLVASAARSAADQLGVPMVGGDLVATDWYQDKNLYPSGGTALPAYAGALAHAIVGTGHAKVGLIYCIEASICGVVHSGADTIAAAARGSLVFQQATSLTQRGYASECRAARSAGAGVLLLAVDGASIQRIAASCAAIGYHPALATAAFGASAAAFNNAAVRRDVLYAGTTEAPFAARNSPALHQFRAAYAQFTNSAPDQWAVKGWASGQLLAAAINALGTAARHHAITTSMVTTGLHMLHHETLGGLIPAMTYRAGAPAPPVGCFSMLEATHAGVVAPNGSAFTCT